METSFKQNLTKSELTPPVLENLNSPEPKPIKRLSPNIPSRKFLDFQGNVRLRTPNIKEIFSNKTIEELNRKELPIELDESRIKENSEKETENFLTNFEMINAPDNNSESESTKLNVNQNNHFDNNSNSQRRPQSIADIESESLISRDNTGSLNISNTANTQLRNLIAPRFSNSFQNSTLSNTSSPNLPTQNSNPPSLPGFNFSSKLRTLLSPTRNISNFRNFNTTIKSQIANFERSELETLP